MAKKKEIEVVYFSIDGVLHQGEKVTEQMGATVVSTEVGVLKLNSMEVYNNKQEAINNIFEREANEKLQRINSIEESSDLTARTVVKAVAKANKNFGNIAIALTVQSLAIVGIIIALFFV